MDADRIAEHLEAARLRTLAWPDGFSAEERVRLQTVDNVREVDRLAYIDGWRRIRRTTPMILAAIARCDALGDGESVSFWVSHLDEEQGHDRIMRDDLVRIHGSEESLEAALAAQPISPPSAALVGFFEWQVANGNPHLLILLRMLLEHIFATMDESEKARKHAIVAGGSQTVTIHSEADGAHLDECAGYLDRHFTPEDEPVLIWCLDFAALMLSDGQVWAAAQALGRS